MSNTLLLTKSNSSPWSFFQDVTWPPYKYTCKQTSDQVQKQQVVIIYVRVQEFSQQSTLQAKRKGKFTYTHLSFLTVTNNDLPFLFFKTNHLYESKKLKLANSTIGE